MDSNVKYFHDNQVCVNYCRIRLLRTTYMCVFTLSFEKYRLKENVKEYKQNFSDYFLSDLRLITYM